MQVIPSGLVFSIGAKLAEQHEEDLGEPDREGLGALASGVDGW